MSTSTIDPDREWAYSKNGDYDHTAWYATPDGAFEKRVGRESPLDSWTGINWNKMPTEAGEYYGVTNVPLFDEQWNEEEYYRNWTPDKTDEQVATELNEPVEKLEEKYSEYVSQDVALVWTPTLARMANTTPAVARTLEYEITPFFQLNSQGYRKNWANVRISEMRPALRAHADWATISTDFFFRFQTMRWNLVSRIRLKYFKTVMFVSGMMLIADHNFSKEYRHRLKWH